VAAAAGLWLSVVDYSYAGVGAIMLILFVAFDMRKPLPSDSEGRYALTRRAPEKAFTGDTVLIELALSNSGDDIERLHVEDGPPYSAQVVRGSVSLDGPLARNSEVTLRYEVVLREPGEFAFGTTKVRLRSMFGLSERSFIFYAPFSVRVYPKHLTPKLSPLRARAFGWAGTTPSRYRGGRLEFLNIRGYMSGDRIRDVNWKASARLGERLVNEWEAERGLDCVVIVDLFSDDVPKVGEWSARGDVIEAAYELTSSFMTSGNRVGMLILGGLLYKVKPGFGMRRLRAMVEGMVDSKEGGVWNLENVEEFLEKFYRKQYVRRGGTLFFVSAGANLRLLSAVALLARRGFVCNTVMVDILRSEGSALTERSLLNAEEVELGFRFAHAELDWFENRLASYSNVFEWSREHGVVQLKRMRA
jgi:uncharacterized protein (DUF58 family)